MQLNLFIGTLLEISIVFLKHVNGVLFSYSFVKLRNLEILKLVTGFNLRSVYVTEVLCIVVTFN